MFVAAMSVSVLLTFIHPPAAETPPVRWRWVRVTPIISLADWTRARELASLVKAGMTEEEVWALLGSPDVSGGSLWLKVYDYHDLGVTVIFLRADDGRLVVKEVDVESL